MKSQGEAEDDSQPGPMKRGPANGRRSTVAALIAVAVLTALLLWISQAILAHNKLQNCLDSGRRDCVPITTDGS